MANAKYPASTTTGWVDKRYIDWGDGHHGDHIGVTIVGPTGTAMHPSTVYYGRKAVAAAGTDVALAASQALASGVQIKALWANTGYIYVGTEGVAAATGFELAAGESVFIATDNLALVWLDAAVNGEGVSYIDS